MSKMNVAPPAPPSLNHEGTKVARLTPLKELRRTLLSCFLWENTFYETGDATAARIAHLVSQVDPDEVCNLAKRARHAQNLRHAPLFLMRELARRTEPGIGRLIADTVADVIQRPDEMGELLAMYWHGEKDPKSPLKSGIKKGIARAILKFRAETLAKYNSDTAAYKLRDVINLTHPKPMIPRQSEVFKQILEGKLPSPDTWEVALSKGADKKATFERLLYEGNLGGLAFLRNLRNMIQSGVDERLIRERFKGNFDRVLPFRFITAATYAPRWEPEIEGAMLKALDGMTKLGGRTALIIDTSPSMWQAKVSEKSEMTRFDAAAALAILARALCDDIHVWAFNEKAYEVPARQGFALRDALLKTKGNYSCGGLAVEEANKRGYDRIIVLTDGQWHYQGMTRMAPSNEVAPDPLTSLAYMMNIATYKNGVGYNKWIEIDGWSESTLTFIQENEIEINRD